jgi:hypothetical protein
VVYLIIEYGVVMRVFKNKDFHKWAKKLKINDSFLLKAVEEMKNGLYEAKLGAGLFKKRLAYGSRGKSGGARTLLVFKKGNFSLFLYGFQKNEIDNITEKEKSALKDLAKTYLEFSPEQFDIAIKHRELIEVKNEKINT